MAAIEPPDQRIEVLASGDGTSGTVLFYGEDHTFGNAIRYILAAQPTTDFVGYSIPHPSEKVIHLRVQTKGGVNIRDAVADACDLLASMTDHAISQFSAAERVARAEGRWRESDHEDADIIEQRKSHGMEEID